MNAFHSNIINFYGEKGKAWLAELPQLVAAISSKLGLRDLKAVTQTLATTMCYQDFRALIWKG